MELITGDMLRGHLTTMALAALERGDAHGFEIWRRLETAAGGALQLKEGSLYPALHRLEAAGLVRSWWEDNPKGPRAPRRHVYRLTKQGTRKLAEGRQEWQQFVQIVGNILGTAT